jgi:hypothetical protein
MLGGSRQADYFCGGCGLLYVMTPNEKVFSTSCASVEALNGKI